MGTSSKLLLAACACTLAASPIEPAHAATVRATAETDPVPSSADAADDPAIWVHPTDTSLSVILGTDKNAGIAVYDLAGNELQFRFDGDMNNVDVRYGFSLGERTVGIAAASNRSNDTIAVYEIDASTGLLSPIAAGGGIGAGISVYGFCLYRSPSGGYYAFVNSKTGDVEQWELVDNGADLVAGTLVRSFDVGGQTEGCVADDVSRSLYIGEENTAIWRYGAEPIEGVARTQVDSTGAGGHLTADIEGLTLFYRNQETGYLLASSQGNDTFAVYEREADNAYVGSFSIIGGAIDGCSDTDGIDVVNVPLGPDLPFGVFVAQDASNPGANQNYKLVPWDDVALAFDPPLEFMSTWDPRITIPEASARATGAGGLSAVALLTILRRRKARRRVQQAGLEARPRSPHL